AAGWFSPCLARGLFGRDHVVVDRRSRFVVEKDVASGAIRAFAADGHRRRRNASTTTARTATAKVVRADMVRLPVAVPQRKRLAGKAGFRGARCNDHGVARPTDVGVDSSLSLHDSSLEKPECSP